MSRSSACRRCNGARRRSPSSSGSPADATEPAELLRWANERVGKTQRLADLRCVAELPRSAIGKVLKRELRDAYRADA